MPILADDFEGPYLWQEYRREANVASFVLSTDEAHSPTHSGYQPYAPAGSNAGFDPAGGYRLFPDGDVNRGAGLGFRCEWWWRHNGAGLGGSGEQMRSGPLNADMNGYTLACETNLKNLRIEKRTGGQVDRTIERVDFAGSVRSEWLRSVFDLHSSGEFDGYVYRADGSLVAHVHSDGDFLDAGPIGFGIGQIPIGRLGTFETFDRFAAMGGVNWYIDDLVVDWIGGAP